MRILRLSVVATNLSLLFVTGLQSQTTQAPIAGSPNESPTISVTTRLVQVNVLAHNHHGDPVADLTKNDFEIKDQGKIQPISLFSVESVKTVNGSQAAQKVQEMPRNEVSNRMDRMSNSPTSATVILYDIANTKIHDQMYARQQMIKFLHQVQPEDRIALYELTQRGFKVIHDFTNNAGSLVAALATAKPGYQYQVESTNPAPSNSGDDNLDNFLDQSNIATANFFQRNLIINTCLSLKVLANHLAGIPGRKNVIWVSGGFPISIGFGDPQDTYEPSGPSAGISHSGSMGIDAELFSDYIREASEAMNTANVAVYPVDARGLLTPPLMDASKSVKFNPRNPQQMTAMNRVDQRNMDTMRYIADLTGGKAFTDTNDINGAIRKAIDDSQVTYLLGYYVSDDRWDNKFHHIKVSCKRPGVGIRTKKGYFAQEQTPPNALEVQRTLHDAVWSPLDSTTIGILARITPSPSVPNASRILFRVNPSELRFSQADGRYKDSIDVLFVQQTRNGKPLVNEKQTMDLAILPQNYQKLLQTGLVPGKDLTIDPGTEAIRIIVLDRNNGATGSVTVPVTALDKSGPTVAAAPPANPPAKLPQ
ncbi:MAG: VWA domain-containing protein [Bryobacteraceae bacterium]